MSPRDSWQSEALSMDEKPAQLVVRVIAKVPERDVATVTELGHGIVHSTKGPVLAEIAITSEAPEDQPLPIKLVTKLHFDDTSPVYEVDFTELIKAIVNDYLARVPGARPAAITERGGPS
ncbi:MAG: hypothetical protein JWO05_2378 [Gemmatimonadetes bacterium]|nr:hypothetical protein [Gemmatimonadota bacterium]